MSIRRWIQRRSCGCWSCWSCCYCRLSHAHAQCSKFSSFLVFIWTVFFGEWWACGNWPRMKIHNSRWCSAFEATYYNPYILPICTMYNVQSTFFCIEPLMCFVSKMLWRLTYRRDATLNWAGHNFQANVGMVYSCFIPHMAHTTKPLAFVHEHIVTVSWLWRVKQRNFDDDGMSW